jgi:hypothetical protein
VGDIDPARLERELPAASFLYRAAIASEGRETGVVEAEEERIDPAPGWQLALRNRAGDGKAQHAAGKTRASSTITKSCRHGPSPFRFEPPNPIPE